MIFFFPQKLIPELQKLFMSKNETNVLKLWPLFVKLLGKVKSILFSLCVTVYSSNSFHCLYTMENKYHMLVPTFLFFSLAFFFLLVKEKKNTPVHCENNLFTILNYQLKRWLCECKYRLCVMVQTPGNIPEQEELIRP